MSERKYSIGQSVFVTIGKDNLACNITKFDGTTSECEYKYKVKVFYNDGTEVKNIEVLESQIKDEEIDDVFLLDD